jgi:hypothetical protein
MTRLPRFAAPAATPPCRRNSVRPLAVSALCACLISALLRPSTPEDRRSLLLDPGASAFAEPAPPRSTVRLDMSKGGIDIEVTRAWSPRGAARVVQP